MMEDFWQGIPFQWKIVIFAFLYISSLITNLLTRKAPRREVQRISRLCSEHWHKKNFMEIAFLERQLDWIEECLHFYTEELVGRYSDCLEQEYDNNMKYLVLGKFELIIREAFKKEVALAKYELKRNKHLTMGDEDYERWVRHKAEQHRVRVLNSIHRDYQDGAMAVPFKCILTRVSEPEVTQLVFKCYNYCRNEGKNLTKQLAKLEAEHNGDLYG